MVRIIIAVACTAALGIGSLQAAESPIRLNNFRKDLPKVAAKIWEIVEGENQAAVSVGQIRDARRRDTNAGPGMVELLVEALKFSKKGEVRDNAALAVSGSYSLIDDPANPDLAAMRLKLAITDSQDRTIVEFVSDIVGGQDIAEFAGITVKLPDGGESSVDNRKKVKEQKDRPQVFTNVFEVKTTADSPYAVEIRSKRVTSTNSAKPQKVTVENGQAYVEIEQQEVYEILVYNRSNSEVGVAISIDGLDVFSFSETRKPDGAPKYTHYIVPPGNEPTTIVGWHLRDQGPDNYSSFLVTEYGKGASAKAPQASQGSVGVIVVSFSKVHSPGGRTATSETGFGPPRSVEVKEVQREIERPHEIVAVRYAR